MEISLHQAKVGTILQNQKMQAKVLLHQTTRAIVNHLVQKIQLSLMMHLQILHQPLQMRFLLIRTPFLRSRLILMLTTLLTMPVIPSHNC